MMKKLNKKVQLIIAAIALAVVALIGCVIFYQMNLKPVSSVEDPVEFEIVEGDSSSSVISRLAQEEIIKNDFVAKLYVKFHGGSDIKAGYFTLDRAWSTQAILEHLSDSANARADQVKITFREGIWAKDIASQLEAQLGIPASDFITLWNDDTYLKTLIDQYEFLDESILHEQTRVKLEGYLYPETYHFEKAATKEEVTATFLDQFNQVYEKYKDQIGASGKSIHDLITMASLVQYEAKTVEDMGLIAGVFYNRLAIDMRLQSSVTICYALYEEYEHAQDCEVNSDIDSPYNTYMNPGLPIGPILNPGEDAILAALKPTENDYLYFMADIYGDGTVYYAKTLEEHDANVNQYLR